MKTVVLTTLLLFIFHTHAEDNEKLKQIVPSLKIESITAYDSLQLVQKKNNVSIIIKNQNSSEVSRALQKEISIDVTKVTVEQLIKYICDSAELNFNVSPRGTVIISTENSVEFKTVVYKVANSFRSIVNPQNIKRITQDELEEFFKKTGVNFPPGSKVFYISTNNRLTLTNTKENHKKVHRMLVNLNILRN